MTGWRAVDQEPVASRHAIALGMAALVDTIGTLCEDGDRPVVTACWQDEAYLDVPPGLLDRLAAFADVTIACVGNPQLTQAAGLVPVEDGEAIAEEWSLVTLAPRGCVALVAHEVAAALPAATVEGGRTFRYDVTDDPQVVVAHARRLLRTFGARMTPEASARLAAAATGCAARSSADPHMEVLTPPINDLIDRADEVRRRGTALPSDTSGLVELAEWLGDAGPRAPSLGMIVVRSGVPGQTHQLREHAARIGRVGDIIVDVPPDAAMMVAPGLHGDALEDRADEICGLLSEVLGTDDVDAVAVDVTAEHARRDLVGNLGAAMARLRERQTASG